MKTTSRVFWMTVAAVLLACANPLRARAPINVLQNPGFEESGEVDVTIDDVALCAE